MEVGEEVSSTSENVTTAPCEGSSVVEPIITKIEEVSNVTALHPDPVIDKGAQLNGDLNSVSPETLVPTDSNEDDGNSVKNVVSPCNDNLDLTIVPDSSVTSTETAEPTNFKLNEEPHDLAISSPTVSATTVECPPIENICDDRSSSESLTAADHDVIKKEVVSLVEKLSMNSSITVSRKEIKSDSLKSESVPEGRVLRLRPTPKTESPKLSTKCSKTADTKKMIAASNSNSSKHCVNNGKPLEKSSKSQKRKYDESDSENDKPNFTIQYKGFKTTSSLEPSKKVTIKMNPFNPAFRRDWSNPPSSQEMCSNFDYSSIQPEYAQYLGLQPLVKFRCSNCGMSSFQTMNALNAHKSDCLKTSADGASKTVVKTNRTDQMEAQNEPKSANIKLTRKVFLCSACGTYYELWNLFLHMREAHRRYICLGCLGMSSSPEKLSEHLKQKHNILSQSFDDPETFSPAILPQAFYLMCVGCDKIYSEEDKFANHKCLGKKGDTDGGAVGAKNPVVSSQTQTTDLPKSSGENNQPATVSGKVPTKRSRETAKKLGKLQYKKEECSKPPSPKEIGASEEIDSAIEVKMPQSEAPVVPTETPSNASVEVEVETPECDIQRVESPVQHTELIPSTRISMETTADILETVALNDVQVEKEAPTLATTLPEVPTIPSAAAVSDVPLASMSQDQNDQPSQFPTVPLPVLFNKKVFKRSGTRRKRPLTLKPRSRKRKTVPISQIPLPELLPNPLNSLPFVTQGDYGQNIEMTTNETNIEPLNVSEAPKEALPAHTNDCKNSNKLALPPSMFKLKINRGMESEADSDDSQKLSLVVDESANNSDAENKIVLKKESCNADVPQPINALGEADKGDNDVILAGDDIQPMALALDDKIDNVPIQSVVKECVRTSCLSCNYCRHAQKIAVNGKHLALHLLSEHRYMPIKNETPDDVINTLKKSLDILENMCFNTETYDSTDRSIHIAFDDEGTFDCFQCNFACGSHKDLFAHKRKLHSKPLLLCIMCKTNFFSYSEMLCHLCPGHYKAEIMFHNVHIQYRCCFCRLDGFPSAFRLMVHLRKTHHMCDICLEYCADQQKLSTHLWKHKVNHLCYRCGISYASKPDITKHLFWKHGHESVLCKKCLQKKWPHVYHFCIPPTSFICEECSASFSKAIALKVHKRLHSEEFPYSCGKCEKKFISKKLLLRHEERHRTIEMKKNGDVVPISAEDDQKDEIINVTDVVDVKGENGNEETKAEGVDETKEKNHRKHKKDKKDKVVDLYDLPPLNLSSDSDSGDEDEYPKKVDNDEKSTEPLITPKDEDPVDTENMAPSSSDTIDETVKKDEITEEPKVDTVEPPSTTEVDLLESIDPTTIVENGPPTIAEKELTPVKTEESEKQADPYSQVEGIWENFYKTNPQNHNLPYPLCAMKSEVAYGIIMGDHDYCMQVKHEPVVIENDVPSSSNLEGGFSDDKIEESKEVLSGDVSTGLNDEKKKLKSPKKKTKVSDDYNSSSSSDSSTDSDSSSCTCGTNCSCSSSSSNSSSSSSSDSDSSGGDDKTKLERRKKKKERKLKPKAESSHEVVKEEDAEEEKPVEATVEAIPQIPIDPPIQESELETEESSTDEEFYDKQPGNIANQIIAEKRNQLIMSVAPVNNTIPASSEPKTEVTPQPKPKSREKKRRKTLPKSKNATPKSVLVNKFPSPNLQITPPPMNFPPSYPTPNTPQLPPPFEPHVSSPMLTPYQNVPATMSTPFNTASPASSENDKSRSSKRRRIPNKFYGYSSGEEEEKPQAKWRKPVDMTPPLPLRIQTPPQPSPTPRIQLTVPKQIIRKPSYHKVQKTPKITIAPPPPPPPPVQPILHPPPSLPSHDSSETDSDAGMEIQLPPYTQPAPLPALPPPPTVHHPHPNSTSSLPPGIPSTSKPEKDVYCYCRCPYDEVSEMIACDDESCPIEWFHFECVNILVPPRGQWYCPGCRKARGLPT